MIKSKKDLPLFIFKKKKKLLQKYEKDILKENWFNVLLKTIEYSRKKEDNFKIKHELIQFFNNHDSLKKHFRYIYIMKLINEVDFDFKASRVLAFTGCYKQAKGSLRTALENVFRVIYFEQHPKSLTNLNENSYYSLKESNIKEIVFKNKNLNCKIINMKNKLSKSTHTSPKQLSEGMILLSFKKEKYKEWLNDFNKVQKLILEMIYSA